MEPWRSMFSRLLFGHIVETLDTVPGGA